VKEASLNPDVQIQAGVAEVHGQVCEYDGAFGRVTEGNCTLATINGTTKMTDIIGREK
jgi:hypothetical protein